MQSSQPLNILFHVSRYWPAIAGAALHTRTMIKYLEQGGHQVDVIRHFSLEETSNEFAFTHSVDQQVKDEQTDIYQISPHGLWRQPLQLLSQYHQDLRIIRPLFSYGTQQTLSQRFAQIARSHQVIHAVYTGLTPTVITAQQVAKQLKIPFILTPLPHIRTGQTLAKSLRALYDRCDKLIAMTTFEKQWLVAQGIAEVPIGSGVGYRLICWFIFTLVAIIFIMAYAKKILKNPESSLVYQTNLQTSNFKIDNLELDTRRSIILFVFTVAIGLLIYGVNIWAWYINEIAGLFLGLGLLTALIYGLSTRDTSEAFVHGAKDMLTAALVIAFARGLLVLAEDAKMIDTILNTVANGAENLPAAANIQVIFFFQSFLNFFIPSGSGQAALTMPIMAPLSDLLGITRQTAILAYQFGDGLSNLILPTSGVTMGVLEIAKIPYDKWFKWCFPLILILSIVAMLLLLPPTIFFEWS